MANSVQRAIDSVPEFRQRYEKFFKQLHIEQYSPKSIRGYSHHLALVCLYYHKIPDYLSEDEVRDYFSHILSGRPAISTSFFLHTVHSLRCYFRILHLACPSFSLPRLRKLKKLPTVLSHEEVRRLLRSCNDLRTKSLLSLIYSAGLRISEACNLELCDLDGDRMLIHIRQGKGGKDRYVPLARNMVPLLRLYYREYKPVRYLFNGTFSGSLMPSPDFYRQFKLVARLAGIYKHVTPHTLRHSYATHLLEMGADILQVKELLGHASLKSTMIYLHVTTINPRALFSPLDRIFPIKEEQDEKQV